MDLDDLRTLWPLALGGTVVCGIIVALAQCAIAEVVVRIAVRLYTRDLDQRSAKREEWIGVIEDMTPTERPGHAASLLWLAIKKFPRWVTKEREGYMLWWVVTTNRFPGRLRRGRWYWYMKMILSMGDLDKYRKAQFKKVVRREGDAVVVRARIDDFLAMATKFLDSSGERR